MEHWYVLCFYSEEEWAFLAEQDSAEIRLIQLSDFVQLPIWLNPSVMRWKKLEYRTSSSLAMMNIHDNKIMIALNEVLSLRGAWKLDWISKQP